jgi:SAM-dependent methyltransferase
LPISAGVGIWYNRDMERFESPKLETGIEKESVDLSEDVLEQLDNLGITPEMVKGSVLDIGARDAEFARDFSNKEDVNITSVDTEITDENRDIVDRADVRILPYKDDSYDMVISHASIPNMFINMYSHEFSRISRESMKGSVRLALQEIIRVLKPGKTAYLAPVLIAENYEPQKVMKEIIFKAIDNLKKENIDVKLDFLNTEINPENNEEVEKYRLTLKKPI